MGIAQEIKGMAMIRSDTILLYCCPMLFGGITFVALPVILRIFLGQLKHIVVTICLGEDARCCYREIFAIALYNGGIGQVVLGLEAIAIHNDCLGT